MKQVDDGHATRVGEGLELFRRDRTHRLPNWEMVSRTATKRDPQRCAPGRTPLADPRN